VAEASGRYICWTDDDVEVDPEWLAAYWAAFQRHPQAAVFGGRITLCSSRLRPTGSRALKDEWPLRVLLAQRDFGTLPCPLDFAGGLIRGEQTTRSGRPTNATVSYEPGFGASPYPQDRRRGGGDLPADGGRRRGWWVPAQR
jgi:hypothetical protein